MTSAEGRTALLRFERRVQQALGQVRSILDTTRQAKLAHDVSHDYDDKFFLAEWLTNAALAAQATALDWLGVRPERLAALAAQSRDERRAVCLRFRASRRCAFVKKKTRTLPASTETVHKSRFLGISVSSSSSKTETRVTEWLWDVSVSYDVVSCLPGSDDETVLRSGAGRTRIKTLVETPPYPEDALVASHDVDLTWLLAAARPDDGCFAVEIDRGAPDCRTPRRNAQIEQAVRFFQRLSGWYGDVLAVLTGFFSIPQNTDTLQLSAVNDDELFVPVLPLFEQQQREENTAPATGSRVALSPGDLLGLLAAQRTSVERKFAALDELFPGDESVVTAAAVQLAVLAQHGRTIAQRYADSVDYVEQLLYAQLTAAVGRVLQAHDFRQYMSFHNRRFFVADAQPQPLCFNVRRAEHEPEGVLSVEASEDGARAPILTLQRRFAAFQPMLLPLNAATTVHLRGDCTLHAWINSTFGAGDSLSLSLHARARQFSSFVLLLGSLAGANVLQPTAAVLVQNKDDLTVPLLLETIASAKQFKKATESLSPEQLSFAKMYRAMQLEGSLFVLAAVQIRPQLERLLRLPADALTQEIALTEDLMELFVKYQLPSDLLSYDGPADASVPHKVARVRQLVDDAQTMLQCRRDESLLDGIEQQVSDHLNRPKEPRKSKKKGRAVFRLRMDEDKCKDKKNSLPSSSRAIGAALGKGGRRAASPEIEAAPVNFLRGCTDQWSLPVAGDIADELAALDESTSVSEAKPPSSESPSDESPSTSNDEVTDDRQQHLASTGGSAQIDLTQLPAELDARLERLDPSGALRPTTISTAPEWTRTRRATVFSLPKTETLARDQLRQERNAAYDLLDALSRSGALPIDDFSMHVVIASTHCFDSSLVETVVEDNVNPIDKLETSTVIVAESVLARPAAQLVRQLARLQNHSPQLF